jgi:hypothetical protein
MDALAETESPEPFRLQQETLFTSAFSTRPLAYPAILLSPPFHDLQPPVLRDAKTIKQRITKIA